MPASNTPPERYADLVDPLGNDSELAQMVLRLDQALQPRPAPSEVHAAFAQVLQARIAAQTSQQQVESAAALSRRDVMKAAAASMAWLLALNHTGPEVAREFARFAEEGPMTGARLSNILQVERRRWNALLAEVGVERMEEPGVEGAWSVKELIAHLTWYERRIVESAQQIVNTGTDPTRVRSGLAALSMDERNEIIAAESRQRPLADVLAEADQVFSQLLGVIAACPDELLNNAAVLGLPDDIPPWMRVANNSYGHFREHEASIRAWLDRSSQPGERRD